MIRNYMIVTLRAFSIACLLAMTACSTFFGAYTEEVNLDIPDGPMYSDDQNLRSVKVEIEEQDLVTRYELEIIPKDEDWAKPLRKFSRSNLFRMRIPPGSYVARSRVHTSTAVKTKWSKEFEFTVHQKSPKALFPKPGAHINLLSNQTEAIELQWPYRMRQVGYLFEMFKQGKLVHRRFVKQNSVIVEIEPKSKYTWTVGYLAYEGAEKDPDLPKAEGHFTVGDIPDDAYASRIKITPAFKAKKYEFQVLRKTPEVDGPRIENPIDKMNAAEEETSIEQKKPRYFITSSPTLKANFKRGGYTVRARFRNSEGLYSGWSRPKEFWVALQKPQPINEGELKDIDPDDPNKSPVQLRWTAVEGAVQYVLRIYDSDMKQIQLHGTNDTQKRVFVEAGKDYFWSVKALSEGEPFRRIASVDAKNLNKFSIQPFIEHEFSQTEEPSAFYGWGRYIVSIFDYEGKNFDTNTLTNQQIFGGSGEGAVGYWFRKTRVGLLYRSEFSGFNIASENFTYWDHSIYLGIRSIISEEERLRVWVGWNYKELPELVTDVVTQSFSINKLSGSGPTIQVSYLKPLYKDIGLHLMARYFYGIDMSSTPSGTPQSPMQSLQLGVFATIPVFEYEKGMVGYTYKYEQAAYPSRDLPNETNQFEYSGHFLSFILEFGWDTLFNRLNPFSPKRGHPIRDRGSK